MDHSVANDPISLRRREPAVARDARQMNAELKLLRRVAELPPSVVARQHVIGDTFPKVRRSSEALEVAPRRRR